MLKCKNNEGIPFVYIAWSDCLHEWSRANGSGYLFKYGHGKGGTDRIKTLNIGFGLKGGVRTPPCLYFGKWIGIECWAFAGAIEQDEKFKDFMKERFRWFDPEPILKGRNQTKNGDGEIYQVLPHEVPELMEIKRKVGINDDYCQIALAVVAKFIIEKFEAEVLASVRS